MTSHDLLAVMDRLSRPRILVLGDLILDRYTWGNAQRISQEAPVIVLSADRRESRPGGAANVVNMLAALDAQVACAGVVGQDEAGEELTRLLSAAGADCETIVRDQQRPTSVKERFIGRASSRHPSQMLRVDHESASPLDESIEAQLIGTLRARIAGYDAVLISDYGKGVCTQRLLRAVIGEANRAGVLVIVDPSRACPLEWYRGVTLIKPNRLEAELATGRKIARPAEAAPVAIELCRQLQAQMALVTLDCDGMVLARRDGSGQVFSTEARAVYDITGAGDMVLATIGLCLAAGTTPENAVQLANVAAGLEVERAGVAIVRREEIRAQLARRTASSFKVLDREQARVAAEECRRQGRKVVFTNGCFDLLHVGHVTYLAEAAQMGNALFVGVNSDASVRRLKGPSRPVIGQCDRAAMLAALACVDHVVVFDEDTPLALLEAIRPDMLVKGGNYMPNEVVGHEIVTAYGGTVRVTGAIDGISTTKILASLSDGQPSGDGQSLRRAG